ncbi:MAG TPA: hypothetical protein VGF13_14280 [Verrucomicrobiae bacterium]
MKPYLSVPLKLPPGYSANDGSVGDLDGDGEYEIVLKSEQRPRDTASTGLTGETILQGYKLDGTLLWAISRARALLAACSKARSPSPSSMAAPARRLRRASTSSPR